MWLLRLAATHTNKAVYSVNCSQIEPRRHEFRSAFPRRCPPPPKTPSPLLDVPVHVRLILFASIEGCRGLAGRVASLSRVQRADNAIVRSTAPDRRHRGSPPPMIPPAPCPPPPGLAWSLPPALGPGSSDPHTTTSPEALGTCKGWEKEINSGRMSR